MNLGFQHLDFMSVSVPHTDLILSLAYISTPVPLTMSWISINANGYDFVALLPEVRGVCFLMET